MATNPEPPTVLEAIYDAGAELHPLDALRVLGIDPYMPALDVARLLRIGREADEAMGGCYTAEELRAKYQIPAEPGLTDEEQEEIQAVFRRQREVLAAVGDLEVSTLRERLRVGEGVLRTTNSGVLGDAWRVGLTEFEQGVFLDGATAAISWARGLRGEQTP